MGRAVASMPQFRHHVKKVAVKPEPKVYWGSVDGSGGSWHSQPPAQTDWNKDGLDGLYKDGHGGALFCQSWSKPEEAPKRDPFLGYQEGWGAGKKAEKKMEGKSASHCDDPWAGLHARQAELSLALKAESHVKSSEIIYKHEERNRDAPPSPEDVADNHYFSPVPMLAEPYPGTSMHPQIHLMPGGSPGERAHHKSIADKHAALAEVQPLGGKQFERMLYLAERKRPEVRQELTHSEHQLSSQLDEQREKMIEEVEAAREQAEKERLEQQGKWISDKSSSRATETAEQYTERMLSEVSLIAQKRGINFKTSSHVAGNVACFSCPLRSASDVPRSGSYLHEVRQKVNNLSSKLVSEYEWN